MLELSRVERSEILVSIQTLADHLRVEMDDKIIKALCLLKDGKLREALPIEEEVIALNKTLTTIKSYLESNYARVVLLH